MLPIILNSISPSLSSLLLPSPPLPFLPFLPFSFLLLPSPILDGRAESWLVLMIKNAVDASERELGGFKPYEYVPANYAKGEGGIS